MRNWVRMSLCVRLEQAGVSILKKSSKIKTDRTDVTQAQNLTLELEFGVLKDVIDLL